MISRSLPSLVILLAASMAAHAAVPAYNAEPATSHLDFSGIQAGAEFKGTFHKFTASVDFSPDDLDRIRISTYRST